MKGKKERQSGNTMQRTDGLCIVFLFLFFPYMLLVALDKIPVAEEEILPGGPEIVVESEKGVLRIPLDEYLCGILAPYLLEDYSEPELEVLSVVLRSNLLYRVQNRMQNEGLYGAEYYSAAHRRLLFGTEYEEKSRYLRELVQRTAGCIFVYEGKIMEVPEFQFSGDGGDFETLLETYYGNYTLYYYY